jgi:hypothetical protein
MLIVKQNYYNQKQDRNQIIEVVTKNSEWRFLYLYVSGNLKFQNHPQTFLLWHCWRFFITSYDSHLCYFLYIIHFKITETHIARVHRLCLLVSATTLWISSHLLMANHRHMVCHICSLPFTAPTSETVVIRTTSTTTPITGKNWIRWPF